MLTKTQEAGRGRSTRKELTATGVVEASVSAYRTIVPSLTTSAVALVSAEAWVLALAVIVAAILIIVGTLTVASIHEWRH
jgi:hypothetical protein